MRLTDEHSEHFSRRILGDVENALREKGISARRASLDVVGHDGLIRDIRAGRIPSADRVAALYDYLDLDFYMGPHRDVPESPDADLDEGRFAAIDVYEAEASAGQGRLNPEEDHIGTLAFKRAWLAQARINPDRAKILRVKGDSMEPTIVDGAVVLVDEQRIEPPGVFAFVESAELRIKRLERVSDRTLAVLSDNPSHRAEFRRGKEMNRLRIIGRVVWTAHKLDGKPI